MLSYFHFMKPVVTFSGLSFGRKSRVENVLKPTIDRHSSKCVHLHNKTIRQ